MHNFIKDYIDKHQITMYEIANHTGLSYSCVRSNLNGENMMKLETLIIISEYIANRQNTDTTTIFNLFLHQNSSFKNALRRDLIKAQNK